MVSDNDMSTESEGNDEEEMGREEGTGSEEMTGSQAAGETSETTPSGAAEAQAKPKAKVGGRRAALRILRENVDTVSKDLASFRKNHEVSSKRMEKQLASLRNEVTSLKSFISKENARARTKQEALLNKIHAKISAPKAKSPRPKVAAKKSKGKK